MPSLLAHESNRKRVSAYELWITLEIRDFEFFLPVFKRNIGTIYKKVTKAVQLS